MINSELKWLKKVTLTLRLYNKEERIVKSFVKLHSTDLKIAHGGSSVKFSSTNVTSYKKARNIQNLSVSGFSFIKTKWYDAKLQPQVMKTRYKQELQKTITFTHNVSVKSTIFSIHISQNLRFYTIYIKKDGLMAIWFPDQSYFLQRGGGWGRKFITPKLHNHTHCFTVCTYLYM